MDKPMSELGIKVRDSIERLKAFEPKEGYYLAFSGGKDSCVIKALADMAGVKYDAHYRVTSVDHPALVRFIKQYHPDVSVELPRYPKDYKNENLAGRQITMWNLIPEKMMPPTRVARYCCEKLKEDGGDGRMTITGVRWAESTNRKNNQGLVTVFGEKASRELKNNEGFSSTQRGGVILTNDNEDTRRTIESCYKRHKTVINPIIDWTDQDVWAFIKENKIPYCTLYDEGWHRLGCIGCPMASKHSRERDFLKYPKFKQAYLKAFDKMLQRRKDRNAQDPSRPVWRQGATSIKGATATDIFNWWMEYDVLPGQLDLFEMEDEE